MLKTKALFTVFLFLLLSGGNHASDRESTQITKMKKNNDFKLGIIGLDSLHSIEFSKFINTSTKPNMEGIRIAVAYPYGSERVESGKQRIEEYSKEITQYGVSISQSLEEVIKVSDGILLITNDGTLHKEQILPVIKAGKPIFLDKPVAENLTHVLTIYGWGKKYGVEIFSASALRYLDAAQAARHKGSVGDVLGADGYSPMYLESQHTDYYWYGIHAVETVYTVLGPGCKRVKRIIGQHSDIIIGEWADGRIGSVRTDRSGKQFYGGMVYGSRGVEALGPFIGYESLAEKIVEFFKSGKSPVDTQETIEIYTFMEAADVSKARKGEWVSLDEVYQKALQAAKH